MPTVVGVGSVPSFPVQGDPSATQTVAAALATLRLRPGSTVAIADTVDHIQKNLGALQALAGRITELSTTDSTKQLVVTSLQYLQHGAILAKWGMGSGNTVEVTGVMAGNAKNFVAGKPAWVSTITVADGSANLQRNLDDLQTLVAAGSVRQIVHTGAATPIKITAAQFAADGDALAAIKNQAYTLAITAASVSDTLGLGDTPALASNTHVKSIRVRDTTDAIEANLDALQRVGLKLKSLAQTDTGNPLTLTASQYTSDALVIGKILTPYQLDVIRASAAQAAKMAANQKVVTLAVVDTAANISRRWALMNRLSDSLTAVEVSDADNAVALTADQLTLGSDVLAKFTDDADHTYKLSVSGVRAGEAETMAAVNHVTEIKVSDTADNVVANLAALETVKDQGLLTGIALTGPRLTLALGADRLQGDEQAATQGVLDLISNGRYGLAVTGVSATDLAEVAANTHVVSLELSASSDEIESNLDALFQLGKRLTKIEQSDSGGALDVTQSQFETRLSVLGKIDSGYRINLGGVTAAKALNYALNSHVASLGVADTGKNLVAHWNELRSIGATLASVDKTDDGSMSLSATNYLAGLSDQLTTKFGSAQTFTLTSSTVSQALQLAADDAVDHINLIDDGGVVSANLADLADLATAGKLASVVLNPGATSVSLHGSQLEAAQGVLDLVRGGRYTLAVDQVDVADVHDLLAGNAKIMRLKATGDAATIAANLASLSAAGQKLAGIDQTDAAGTALELTGDAFELNRNALNKITGGFLATLSGVAAAKAATLAASTSVKSLQVSDTAAHLATSWNALGTLGSKLTDIAQSDTDLLQLTALQWSAGAAVAGKFSTTLGVSVSGVRTSDLATLDGQDAVQQVQVSDTADAIADAWSDLAADSKLTRLRITDPATAMALTAATYATSTDLLAKIGDGLYHVALSEVAVADAATLGADAHVDTLDVTGDSTEIGSGFASLSTLDKLGSITLSDAGGTLALSSAQVLGGAGTLAKIGNAYQIAASGVALADLADIQAVTEVVSIGVSDSAANVSGNFDTLLALGATLSSLHFDDTTPVLALTQADWTAGAATLAKADGSYQVDLSAAEAGSVATLADDTTVRQVSVADTAANIATHWSALVAAYGAGSGKLTALALSDDDPLSLTEAQQTDGAALIAALLPDEEIVTAT